MPSKHVPDIVRWILHMQCQLTGDPVEVRRNNAGVPKWFERENVSRPISPRTPEKVSRRHFFDSAPFGRKMADDDMDAVRDHYGDMMHRRKEFAGEPVFGIESQRIGGEGRRHLQPVDHMVGQGLSKSSPRGVETLREAGEGRRYIRPRDNVQEHIEENEAVFSGFSTPPPLPRARKYMSENDTFAGHGSRTALGTGRKEHVPGEVSEFDRKRHIPCEDHMLTNGMADASPWKTPGRRNLDAFSLTKSMDGGAQPRYVSSWKQDPRGLRGRSLFA